MLDISALSILQPELEKVEKAIHRIFDNETSVLYEYAKPTLFSGGKRIRPLLFLLAEKTLNSKSTLDSEIVAACFELLHVASLAHDDVIDDSDMRRGKPTINETFSSKHSILVGDFLLLNALNSLLAPKLNKFMPLILTSLKNMIEGEGRELNFRGNINITLEQCIDVNYLKTSSVFANVCKAGAIIAKGSPKEIKALENFGLQLGNAFQLVDDILDYKGNQDNLGKPIFNDFIEKKPTIPLILAFSKASIAEKEFLKAQFLLNSAEKISQQDILDVFSKHKVFEITQKMSMDFIDKAKKELSVFMQNQIVNIMHQLCDFIVNRKN